MTRLGRFARFAGFAAAAVGAVLIAVSAYYLVLYMRSGSDADQFNVELSGETRSVLTGKSAPRPDAQVVPEVVPLSGDAVQVSNLGKTSGGVSMVALADSRPVDPLAHTYAIPVDDAESAPPAAEVAAEPALDEADPVDRSSIPVSDTVSTLPETAPEQESIVVSPELFASLHPGGSINPRYWSDPKWAGNLPFGGPELPPGFIPVDSADGSLASLIGIGSSEGRRMRIPAIDLDATVDELELRNLGDSSAWSTPDRVVGHIPSTANPGEARLGWYFGHLDNFISNEGDIFRHLPRISELIRFDPVDIYIETDEAEYVYRVTGTRQVHRDQLHLTDTNDAQIVLVTCWPFRVYDHRILVSASLIAIRPFEDDASALSG